MVRGGECHVAGEGVEVGGAREGDGVVAVLALVGGDDDGGVVGGALHTLLHRALSVGAPVVAPWEWAVLDGLLAVLAPAVSILEVVDVALGHEGEPRLPRTLLILLPRFAIIIAPRRRRTRLPRRRLAPARTQYIIIISTNI